MSIIEEFSRALELVERYEKYKLIRAWGLILIITGIARFLLGFIIWNLFYLIYKSLNTDINNIAFLISVLNSILQFILIFSLAVIVIYTYVSIRQTSIKEGKILFEVHEEFYKGLKVNVDEAIDLMRQCSIVNMVGPCIVEKAVENGLVHPDAVLKISGVPHAQIVKF